MRQPFKSLRETLGLTQAQFGSAIGVSTGRVCQVEKGSGTFKPAILLMIADRWRVELARLGFSAEDLVRGDQLPPGDSKEAA